MPEENNLLYFITRSAEFLKKKGIPQPRLEAEVLLSHILNIPRIQLYAKFDMPLGESEKNSYRDLIKKRGDNIPSAYLLGKKNFYGYDFLVNDAVLIPRPETEELVELAYHRIQKNFPQGISALSLLDLCCGSGCIGITLHLLFNKQEKDLPINIDLLDISVDALEVSRSNLDSLIHPPTLQDAPVNPPTSQADSMDRIHGSFRLIISNLFDNLDPSIRYHCIVTNPPYVLPEEELSLSEEVKKEPRLALVVEEFEEFHKRLLSGAKKHLMTPGLLLIETNPRKIGDLALWAEELGFLCETKKDLSGKERFLLLTLLDKE